MHVCECKVFWVNWSRKDSPGCGTIWTEIWMNWHEPCRYLVSGRARQSQHWGLQSASAPWGQSGQTLFCSQSKAGAVSFPRLCTRYFLFLCLIHFLLLFSHISETVKWLTSSTVYQASVKCSSDCGTKRKVSGLVYRAETPLSLSLYMYYITLYTTWNWKC